MKINMLPLALKYTTHLAILLLAAGSGFILALTWETHAIYAVIDYEIQANDWLAFSGSIIGAFATVFAALITAIIADAFSKRNAVAERLQKLTAARAILNADLNSITRYLHDGAKALSSIATYLWNEQKGTPIERSEILEPKIDSDLLVRLANLASLETRKNGIQIVEFMKELQIQNARITDQIDIYNRRGERNGYRLIQTLQNLESSLESTISLYIRAACLFDYARHSTDEIRPPSYTEGESGNAVFNLDLTNYPDRNSINSVLSLLSTSAKN